MNDAVSTSRSSWRPALALAALPVLTVVLMFLLLRQGLFDGMVIARYKELAQAPLYRGPNVHWLGAPAWQYPTDLVVYQEILDKTRPDLIIETGTYHGGLTVFLSSVLDQVKPEARIVTVDISATGWKQTLATLDPRVKERLLPRIEFLEGSSTAPEILEAVKKNIKPGNKVLVILDSNHEIDHVLKELELYAPLVSRDSFLIVNDTHLEDFIGKNGQGGAREALRQFMLTGAGKGFAVDRAWNKYDVTCFPDSVLKRGE
jgi:cephalosporin hydroxylase